MYEAVEIHL